MKSKYISVLIWALAVLILDQWAKYIVVTSLSDGESISVIDGLFNLVLVYNKGAAFGMFSTLQEGTRQLLLWGTTIVALLLVCFFLFRDYAHDRVARWALSLIIGGALGNIVDRARLGKVVDFLDLYWNQYHWPAFNVADSAICIGVAILLFRSARSGSGDTKCEGVAAKH